MTSKERKILLKKEVKMILRIKSDSAFQEMINAGEFPRGFRIGLRRVGWFEDEVNKWINDRVFESRGEVAQ
ncbi:helix-turn-helix transcriptional regulator [Escherichia fergusonii]|uniref:AlpA family phage regulatory protein n=1 Tax=Escherichia fergusonii TaxID=564 RepID=A0A7W3ESA5_ESCFE|nr:AlpA family phage regulatory protein [Escherichia fergusonii]EHG6162983.1 AlpA family phage regulatory protein [Escherichia fergusonii]EHG7566383.1 AlpA family phage regulatory protein [Escherichia fergusonii]MBA8233474.1 AlpA family phage regulatory protein [Escherichia fergusonii]MBA8245390.1 AlpA family phage regulatory protein [Escherichia fergusonii]QLM08891.1 AlpA family phage regulatory protein [Escherichia fergusonii]